MDEKGKLYMEGHFADLVEAGHCPDCRPPPSSLPPPREGARHKFETGFVAALRMEAQRSTEPA